MSISEIIEFKGRKFQRLGIMEFPLCGQWYLLGRLPVLATRNHADFETKIKRELLRELPAETPAPATAQAPRCPKCGSEMALFCYLDGRFPEMVCLQNDSHNKRIADAAALSEFFPASSLLAEAEEALERMAAIPIRNAERWKELIARGEYRDDPGSQHAAELRADENRTVAKQIIIEAEAVLARIRAAKEKP